MTAVCSGLQHATESQSRKMSLLSTNTAQVLVSIVSVNFIKAGIKSKY